ncbi:Glutathione S-transferase [Roseovarius litorisediminis]|uniref:Glutathione S-transferase n=1 Tax=Roseovarius litorisediminis TaxID=1312363 RepID=A0A1Y5RT17_9RHOB|nr:glutathione S-transferase family protein [Roseovarius litorisediminis]SLN24736.1 Glutathione S-transferase [Roseovarius litorisediminis]
MGEKPILYGFDGSTYVRTVRMFLIENGIEYDQVPVNVLEGETRLPEHLARHPFGKVPVLDIDGMRLRETSAICRYLDEIGNGPCRIPADAKARAKMDEAVGLFDCYGYNALVGVAGFYLFPDLIGGQDDEAHKQALEDSGKLIDLLMEEANPWIGGDTATLADYLLAPIMFYVSLTPDADKVLGSGKIADWWAAMQTVESFKATEPDLG